MKKTKLTRLIAAFLSLMMLVTALGVTTSAADASSSQVGYDIAEVQDLLNAETYAEYAERNADVPRGSKSVTINAVNYNKEKTDAKVSVTDGALKTPASGTVTWDVEIPADGKYAIDIEYNFPEDGKSTNIERKLRIDDAYPFKGARYLSITKVWRDKYETAEDGSATFKTDLNGNDIRPTKYIDPEWMTYTMSDSTGYDINP